ncbi:MAG TPA: CAP domain-containing protein [Candidatus Binataceae bacterium]|nr:CAP domain-containing protein [Candidatus Binataceae bacterium]
MPTPKVVRHRRAIKAGLGLLAISLVGAALARVYLFRTAPEQVAALAEQEALILSLVNTQRSRVGRKPLKLSARLAAVARGHSQDMAVGHYLTHQSPDGIGAAERIRAAGIEYRAAGETIYEDDSPTVPGAAERAVRAWLASAEHRDTMLSDQFTDTGVGIGRSSDGRTYVTEDFVR